MIKVSCIIPTYNEKPRLMAVLEVVANHPLIDEVIVVDDGSTDGTIESLPSLPKTKVIVHEINSGKSAAVHTGITASTGSSLLLIDADLVGLTAKNISDLLAPVLAGEVPVSFSLRSNTPYPWRVISLDYLAGERVLPRQMLVGEVDRLLSLPRFGLEVFFNSLIIKNNYKFKVVPWPAVASPFKFKKYGFWVGVKSDWKMMGDIFNTIHWWGPVYQIVKLQNLKVK